MTPPIANQSSSADNQPEGTAAQRAFVGEATHPAPTPDTAVPPDQKHNNMVAPEQVLLQRSAMKDWIDIGTKATLGLFTACYVIGLLVVNLYLRQYGLAQFGLLQVEYVLTGIVWLFLVAFATFTAKYCRHQASKILSDRKSGEKRFWPALVAIGTIVLLPAFFFEALSFLSGWTLPIYHWKAWLAGTFLAFQGWSAILVRANARAIIQMTRDRSILQEMDHAMINAILFQIVGFMCLIALYASDIYPLLSPTFGGGRQSDISLVIKADQVPMARALGFKVTDDRLVAPVKLIIETPEFLLVMPPDQKDHKHKLTSIRIRRDLVDAVLYIEPAVR